MRMSISWFSDRGLHRNTHRAAAREWAILPTRQLNGVPSVDGMNLPIVAGTLSTVLFAVSMLPMLRKAARTKDLTSYSLSYLTMTNMANAVHSVYVFNLPPGPIWLLHCFYVVASALMLIWFLRYRYNARTVPSSRSRHALAEAGSR